jgi:hypothetical protein
MREFASSRTFERPAAGVLFLAWRFTDDHQVGSDVAMAVGAAENDVTARLPEVARLTGLGIQSNSSKTCHEFANLFGSAPLARQPRLFPADSGLRSRPRRRAYFTK